MKVPNYGWLLLSVREFKESLKLEKFTQRFLFWLFGSLLWEFCLLGDTKLSPLLKLVYTEKAFRPHELGVAACGAVSYTHLQHIQAIHETRRKLPDGGRKLVVDE